MIPGISESKALTNHASCKCKCNFDDRKCNSNQKWNNDNCWCECKKHDICEKDYNRNPATCRQEKRKYLASIIVDSVIRCAEIIDAERKTILLNFNKKKKTMKQKVFYFTYLFINYLCIIDTC